MFITGENAMQVNDNDLSDQESNNEFNINQLFDFPELNIPPIKRCQIIEKIDK